MLVFCEECGKRYSFPPEQGEPGSGRFRCRSCGFLMTVAVPAPAGADCPSPPDPDQNKADRETDDPSAPVHPPGPP